jgi:hypothetical protein
MALPTLFKVWIDEQPDEKALQRADEQHSDGNEPMQLASKNESDRDNQEHQDHVPNDLHLLLTSSTHCSFDLAISRLDSSGNRKLLR